MSRLKPVPVWPYQIADPDWDNLFKNFNEQCKYALQTAKDKCEIESLTTVQDISKKADGVSYVSIKNIRKSYYREDAAFIYVSPSKRTKIGGVFDGHGHPAGYGMYAAIIGAELCKHMCLQIQYDTWSNREDIITNMNELFTQLDRAINDALSYLFHATIDTDYGIIHNTQGNLILGGTTCTIAISHINQDNKPITVISYVGDSDAYILHSGGLLKISKYEHSPTNPEEKLKNGAKSRWNIKNNQFRSGQLGATKPTNLNKTYLARSKELPSYKPGSLSVQMTRSLGDFFVAHSVEPTVEISDGLFCIIIASDGVWDLKDDDKYLFTDRFHEIVYTSHFDSTEIIRKLQQHVDNLMTTPTNKYDDMTLLIMGDISQDDIQKNTIQQLLSKDLPLIKNRLDSIKIAAMPDATMTNATVPGGNRRKTRHRKNHKARTATKSHKTRHNKTRTTSCH
jgi:serine/threonine protein phosphatase PrpC